MNRSQGPKARNKQAQGNALGKRSEPGQAPKGRDNENRLPSNKNDFQIASDWLKASYSSPNTARRSAATAFLKPLIP
jgi:hypothetical protein